MKLLIFLALSTFSVTAFYQIHLTRFESPMMKMIKAGTWNDYIMKKDVIRAVAHKTNKKYTQNVTDYDNTEYTANITVGTPGQLFRVTLDTTTAFLWVPDITCKDEFDPIGYHFLEYEPRHKSANEENAEDISLRREATGCRTKNKFNQTESSTYVYNGTVFKTSFQFYTFPFWAFGFLGEDTVTFGEIKSESLTVPNVTFGQANFISSAFAGWPIDGILGMAFPALDPHNIASPFFEAVKQELVDPLFTVYLINDGNDHVQYDGLFTYGGLDDVNCESDITYEALTSATYYQFRIGSVQYGSYSSYQGWTAILDTSNAYIFAPYWVTRSIVKEAGGYFSHLYMCYIVDCQTELPDIELGIGAKTYKIGRKVYIHEVLPGICCLRLFYNGGTGFGPEWRLGYPFLWSHCITFDIGNKQIGFALPKMK